MATCMYDMHVKLESREASRFSVELSAAWNSVNNKFSSFVSVWLANDWLLLLVGAIFSHCRFRDESKFFHLFLLLLNCSVKIHLYYIFMQNFYAFDLHMLISISKEKFWGIFHSIDNIWNAKLWSKHNVDLQATHSKKLE